jgi:hypothetical protein
MEEIMNEDALRMTIATMKGRTPINEDALRIALATRNWRAWQLAAKIGLNPSTLSAYRRGHHFAPRTLVALMEEALGLAPGALATSSQPTNANAAPSRAAPPRRSVDAHDVPLLER